MDVGKNRIGLIISNIFTEWAMDAWPYFVRTALKSKKNLFIFPGGRLNSPMETDSIRNSVYSLVNSDNLDGLISWSASIIYMDSKEALGKFHSEFEALPFVTLEYKIPGKVNVNFDSYTGMKQLITHSISIHGARKIAFLQGPSSSPSNMARFNAYKDALRKANIPHDNSLVTAPFVWDEGEKAAAQLFEERKLIPGRDFDTLVGASDRLIFDAINYFIKKGYSVPKDYHALGFDDAIESQLCECRLSTVSSPYPELSAESFRILDKIILNTEASFSDILLPAEPVIRESCGCVDLFYQPVIAPYQGETMSRREQTETLIRTIAGFFKLSSREGNVFLAPLVRSYLKMPFVSEFFFKRLEKILRLYFINYKNADVLFRVLKKISTLDSVSPGLYRKLEPAILKTILKTQEWFLVYSHLKNQKLNAALASLKCELLENRTRKSLMHSLARHLPEIGITTAGLALHIDEKTSLWIGCFSPSEVNLSEEISFPGRLLVPAQFKQRFSGGIFVIQPLFADNQPLGYFIHTISGYEGMLFEELRHMISYALKGIFLIEEAGDAKQKMQESDEYNRRLAVQKEAAQAAYEAKSRFLEKLSGEIRAPLNTILEITETLFQDDTLSLSTKDALKKISGSGGSLSGIISDLLD